MRGLSWQVVAFTAVGLAGFLILFWLIPVGDPLRQPLIMLVVSGVGAMVTWFVSRKIDTARSEVSEARKEAREDTETVHKIVNQQRTDMMDELETQRGVIAELRETLHDERGA